MITEPQKELIAIEIIESLYLQIDEIIEAISIFANTILDFCEGALYLIDNTHKSLDLKYIWGTLKYSDNFALDECWALRRNSIHYFSKNHPAGLGL